MIKLSIIICTYNRRKNIEVNLDLLNKRCRSFIEHVYVIDNASNLPKTLGNNFISIIYNRNLGGSGGYARGMYEAVKKKDSTHIMLMDDDVKFDSEILKAAVEKIKDIDKNDWLAFGMRIFEKPNIIFENTALWNGIYSIKNHHNYDINSNKKWKLKKYNYAAWWSLIMPISVVCKYGYPMPYFIKADDVEYGLRRNEQIHCYKNISVLHEDLSSKYNPKLDYYNIRNYMITNALHFKHGLIKSYLMFLSRMTKAFFTGNYKKIKLSIIGLNDFLLGSSSLKNIEANNIRINNIENNIKATPLKLFCSPAIILAKSILLIIKYKKAKTDYIKNFKYLTSDAFWAKQFSKK